MTKAQIKQKLHDYIETAESKKLQAIYTILESEMVYDWRKDEEWIAELNRREEECINGTAKTYSLEEAMDKVRASVKKTAIAK